jgi:putative ABC transport system substrate-binding protein
VGAQQPDRVRRIGVLMGTAATKQYETDLATFLRRLEELGWKKDHNARTEVRWWTGGPEQMRPVVAELLAFSPDVIMVYSNLALAILKPMAEKVPVVFVGVGDPVGDGFVTSLARPGGKWLEVLKETAPHVTRVMAVFHPETPIHPSSFLAFDRRFRVALGRRGHTLRRSRCYRNRERHIVLRDEGEWWDHCPPACHYLGK